MAVGECQTRNVNDNEDDDSVAPPPLDEGDIKLLKTYGLGPYTEKIKKTEKSIQDEISTIKKLIGIVESDQGLSQPSQWDLVGDKQMMSEEQCVKMNSSFDAMTFADITSVSMAVRRSTKAQGPLGRQQGQEAEDRRRHG